MVPFETDRNLIELRNEFDAIVGGAPSEWTQKSLAAVLDPVIEADLDAKREAVLKDHPIVRSVNWNEIKALSEMPSAPKRLTNVAIAWGKASAGKDGAPEALALAVRTTRYGCNWHGPHRVYSRAAHDLLHKKFGGDELGCHRRPTGSTAPTSTTARTRRTPAAKARDWPKQKIPR